MPDLCQLAWHSRSVRPSRSALLVLTALALAGCATGPAANSDSATTYQGAYVAQSGTTTLSLPVEGKTSSSAARSSVASSPSPSTMVPASRPPATATGSNAPRAAASTPTTASHTTAASHTASHRTAAPTAAPSSVVTRTVATTSPRTVTPAATATSTYIPIVARKYGTGNATQIVTVTAASSSSTTATLSVWKKVGSGWVRVYGPLKAWVGVDGVGKASEYTSKTPAGSFTLTQAFGRLADPGTRLPYFTTTPRDWWVGQSGPYYNTHQRCTAGHACPWHSPSEHLYYETPYYNYAAVIDYNTRNAPGGVRQHAGSAFFFHVHPAGTGGTGGCVAIGQKQLVKILKWLRPARHPRIIIGVA